ncbi:Ubiquinone/menaquinone biosynthesis C-methylase UbiE [Candidatus Frackibacter sp. WG12]|uniref:class I SAM-dependent methyltransferase n=1 Tax=unclassified Candidatus Frackibacter TaxID=2648818 RepID=UPI00079417F1|nr:MULTISPECIES: class I SAM-dependent methyltransferase [unclassified Candidatus Frackibacter]KXS43051.1 MAG: type 11 methyltransferase [Candidatus Frackibacter sp. T328-2]SDC80753.1 Ubiquinone/menaquinone biosynthesis C-methylase UbiE [Candidatus Frackibacter sp. WG11]SEM93195.1 Ubiquinone/menaquinone biosynthesis C-methylase UbiE [Candidatus Frackibacter sp. WG12]
MTNDHTDRIKKRYNRVARVYDLLEAPMELMAQGRLREEVFSHVEGRVLEVGIGTGKNIDYYPEGVKVVGIDFSEKMLERAREKLHRIDVKIDLIEMDAQDMTFADNTFDTVVTTCVFCSVPDPIKGLKEINRVCKPEGKVIMLEHVRSKNLVLGKFMDLINPIPVRLWGANINRKTVENVREAGLKIVEVKDVATSLVKLIIAKPS